MRIVRSIEIGHIQNKERRYTSESPDVKRLIDVTWKSGHITPLVPIIAPLTILFVTPAKLAHVVVMFGLFMTSIMDVL